MFSWFRKKPAKIEVPIVREPSPCGDDEEHYFWVDDDFMPLRCPICVAKEQQIEKSRIEGIAVTKALAEATAKAIEQEALAQRIAAIVIRHLTDRSDWK